MALRGNLTQVAAKDTVSTDWLSPQEVAAMIGCTHSRVCQLLRSREMIGLKIRDLWLISRAEAEKFRRRPPGSGRPRVGETRRKKS